MFSWSFQLNFGAIDKHTCAVFICLCHAHTLSSISKQHIVATLPALGKQYSQDVRQAAAGGADKACFSVAMATAQSARCALADGNKDKELIPKLLSVKPAFGPAEGWDCGSPWQLL